MSKTSSKQVDVDFEVMDAFSNHVEEASAIHVIATWQDELDELAESGNSKNDLWSQMLAWQLEFISKEQRGNSKTVKWDIWK